MSKEVYKPIPQWPGYYASNTGKIYRDSMDYVSPCGRNIHLEARELSQHLNKYNGYLSVVIGETSLGRKRRYVHRLVASAFIGEIPDEYEVDHIDTNRLNNNVDNLRIVTRLENNRNPLSVQHIREARLGTFASEETKQRLSAMRRGKPLHKNTLTALNGYLKRKQVPVEMLSKDGNVIQVFESATIASKKTHIPRTSINACCLGRRSNAHGYNWRFAK